MLSRASTFFAMASACLIGGPVARSCGRPPTRTASLRRGLAVVSLMLTLLVAGTAAAHGGAPTDAFAKSRPGHANSKSKRTHTPKASPAPSPTTTPDPTSTPRPTPASTPAQTAAPTAVPRPVAPHPAVRQPPPAPPPAGIRRIDRVAAPVLPAAVASTLARGPGSGPPAPPPAAEPPATAPAPAPRAAAAALPATTPAATAPRLDVAAVGSPATTTGESLVIPLAGLVLLVLIAAGFAARARITRDLEARWPDA
jgi:hypothetical protein